MTEQPGSDLILDVPYLLALNAGATIGPDGHAYCDPSWGVDLVRHARHLPQLTFFAPVNYREPRAIEERLPDGLFRLVPYRHFGGRYLSYLALPRMIGLLLREVPKTQIVHTCVAGLPFPVGWIAIPIARLFGKKIVVTLESSFWRLNNPASSTIRERFVAGFWERMTRWCMRQVHYAAYQHEEYRRSFPAPKAGGGVLYQASWVETSQILPSDVVSARWDRRIAENAPPRFLFASRMVPEKGTDVVAATIRLLGQCGANVTLHIIGAGPELAKLQDGARTPWAEKHVKFFEPMRYGPAFLQMLTTYDAVLVPSLSDEQPRIIYDAYSQGTPVIATDRPGSCVSVADGQTGRIVSAGDAVALADTMCAVARDLPTLARWGLAARDKATHFTHERMHEDRISELRGMLSSLT